MKLTYSLQTNESFLTEKMKNERLMIFLFYTVSCTATLILAIDQQAETEAPNEEIKNSPFELHQSNPSEAPFLQSPDEDEQILPPKTGIINNNDISKDEDKTMSQAEPESETEASSEIMDSDKKGSTKDQSSTSNEMSDTTDESVIDELSNMTMRRAVTSHKVPEIESTLSSTTLEKLESCYCTEEASKYGHEHISGIMVHEVLCEIQKLFHYVLIAGKNLKRELQQELLIEGENDLSLTNLLNDGVLFDIVDQGLTRLKVFLENPENLKVLSVIIKKSVPISAIQESLKRLRSALKNILLYAQELLMSFESPQSIDYYTKVLKELEEKILNTKDNILSYLDIYLSNHIESKTNLLLSFINFYKVSFPRIFKQQLMLLKELADTLVGFYHAYYASEFAHTITATKTFIATLASNFFSYVFKMPIIYLASLGKALFVSLSVSDFTYIWQEINGIFPNSTFPISLSDNVTCSTKETTVPEAIKINLSESFLNDLDILKNIVAFDLPLTVESIERLTLILTNNSSELSSTVEKSSEKDTFDSTLPVMFPALQTSTSESISDVPQEISSNPLDKYKSSLFSQTESSNPIDLTTSTSDTNNYDSNQYVPSITLSPTGTTGTSQDSSVSYSKRFVSPSSTLSSINNNAPSSMSYIQGDDNASLPTIPSFAKETNSHRDFSHPTQSEFSSKQTKPFAPFTATVPSIPSSNVQFDTNVPCLPLVPSSPPEVTTQKDFSSSSLPITPFSFKKLSDSSSGTLMPDEKDRITGNDYDKNPNVFVPLDRPLPMPDSFPNFPRYQPLSESYVNYLERADSFYRNFYSYLQNGNSAIAPRPPTNAVKTVSELLKHDFPSSLPIMISPNPCGTYTFSPPLSNLNRILNDVTPLQLPLYLSRKELVSALGNALLPGDLVVIFPKNGIGLIGRILDTISPIYFKVHKLKSLFTDSQNNVEIWHLRSTDFLNPVCEQQLQLLFQN